MKLRLIMILVWTVAFFLFPVLIIGPLPLLLPAPISAATRYNVRLASVIAPFSLGALGFFLGVFGFLPCTRKPVVILVRVWVGRPEEAHVPMKAARVRGGAYRVLSADGDPAKGPWEFCPGETVQCIERWMAGGQRVLVATHRSSHVA